MITILAARMTMDRLLGEPLQLHGNSLWVPGVRRCVLAVTNATAKAACTGECASEALAETWEVSQVTARPLRWQPRPDTLILFWQPGVPKEQLALLWHLTLIPSSRVITPHLLPLHKQGFCEPHWATQGGCNLHVWLSLSILSGAFSTVRMADCGVLWS